ncbi:MAG: hypothetical protein ABIY37_04745, partial [Devosia sp.]
MSDIAAPRDRNAQDPLAPSRLAYIFYPILLLAVLGPLSWALFGGFKGSGELFVYPPSVVPRSPTLQNFIDLFTRLEYGRYIWNTIVVAFWTVLFTLFFGGL